MELYFLEGKWVGFRGGVGLLDCNHTFFFNFHIRNVFYD